MNQSEIDQINKMNIKLVEEEYDQFLKSFKKGKCYLCGDDFNYFNKDKPCLHWLLYPDGIKKKYFDTFFKLFDLFRINSFLMWVSYQENDFANINNLSLEKDKNKIWEVTIKYKNLKWSITCSQTDFTGHKDTKNNFPHYHFLMNVNGKPFISFDDFHIKLTNKDIIRIKCHNKSSGKYVHRWFIPGMEELFSLGPKELLKGLKVTEDESSAPLHVMGIFKMNGGISEEAIHKALMKYKETGDSLVKCFSEIPKIKCNVIIEPGEGVPNLDRKLSRGKKKK